MPVEYLEPKPRERNELARAALQQIFDEPEFKTYRYQNRSFRIGIGVDGASIGDEGELPLTLCLADDNDELAKRIEQIRSESQQKSHENDLYWLFGLTPEIDELVGQLHASRKMADKYNQLSAQQKISPDEATCLQDEKNSKNGYETRLRDKLTEAMESGTGMFRGVQKDASALGKSLSEILKKLFGQVVPDLYPKLQMGSRPLKGDEAEQILKAADLKALSNVFYVGDHGLGLVVKDGHKNIVNTNAPVAKEDLQEVLALYPDHKIAAYNMGVALTNLGKTEEAFAAYRQLLATETDEEDAKEWDYRGLALQRLGCAEEALSMHERASALDSGDSSI